MKKSEKEETKWLRILIYTTTYKCQVIFMVKPQGLESLQFPEGIFLIYET